jgi:hypothetical protein
MTPTPAMLELLKTLVSGATLELTNTPMGERWILSTNGARVNREAKGLMNRDLIDYWGKVTKKGRDLVAKLP